MDQEILPTEKRTGKDLLRFSTMASYNCKFREEKQKKQKKNH